MRTNVRVDPTRFGVTHEGAPAARMTDEQALRRSVMSCLLWESEFYEDGVEIATRILDLAGKVPAEKVAALAIEARHEGNLRHAPLLLLTALAKHGGPVVADTVARVISRADELAELVAIYQKANPTNTGKRRDLSAQLKRGIARAAMKFDEYQFGKYDRDSEFKLRDVMRLAHWRAELKQKHRLTQTVDSEAHEAHQALYTRVDTRTLKVPDTWEIALRTGGDKRETFERLIREGRLGYLALLRNLRNMVEAGCDLTLIDQAIVARRGGADKVLPFRFVAAARACPQLESAIDTALCENIASGPRLDGATIVLVDVSSSMDAPLSERPRYKGKSAEREEIVLTRADAAAALASVIHADKLRVFSFSNRTVEVPARRGMAGIDAVLQSQDHGSTMLGAAVQEVNRYPHDRLIVLTDEQSHDRVPAPKAKHAYMINVASARHGVGYGPWVHLDGFSESVIRWLVEHERAD